MSTSASTTSAASVNANVKAPRLLLVDDNEYNRDFFRAAAAGLRRDHRR